MSDTNINVSADANAKKKKFMATALLCGAVIVCGAALMIRGITAYLTETDTVTNTFTVGEVTVDTLEPNFPGNGSDEVSDLVSLEEVPKDPQIRNTGKNRVVAFIQIDIPMANIIVADEEGNRFPRANTEIFDFRTTSGQFDSYHYEKWVELRTQYLTATDEEATEGSAAKVRRLYGYSTVLEEDETTVPIFDVVRLCNVIEGEIDNSVQNIVITTYAIQADNISGVTSANWTETMDQAKLMEIFNVYMAQSSEVESEDADTGNYLTNVNTTLNLTMTVQNTHLKLNSGNPADAQTTTEYKVAYTGPNQKPVPTFTSSNEKVVTVDQSGNIKAVGVGSAVITMTATNPDNDKVVTATVTVNVKDMNPGTVNNAPSDDEAAADPAPGEDASEVDNGDVTEDGPAADAGQGADTAD